MNKIISEPESIPESNVRSEIDEDEMGLIPRHKNVFAFFVTHQKCQALTRVEIDQLRRRETTLADQCRLCFYRTMFDSTESTMADRSLFYQLLLKVDPESNSAESGFDHLEYSRFAAKDDRLFENTLLMDEVLKLPKEDEIVEQETRYFIRSNKKDPNNADKPKFYEPDARNLFSLTKAWNIKNGEP